MTDSELMDALRRQRAAVVHFSHDADMGRHVTFPGDLQDAIANKDRWTLSCHVVWPGHGMHLVGSVGIILSITSISQVISVSHRDAGSRQLPDGSDVSDGVRLSRDSFEATFQITGAYNEWRVKGAGIIGIFVAHTNNVYAKKKQLVGRGEHRIETIARTPTSISEIIDAFPDYDIYTMDSGGLKLVQSATPSSG